MANDINTRQNDEHILKCLVAQRRLYSTAKKWDYIPQSFIILGSLITVLGNINDGSCWQWIMAGIIGIAWIFTLIGETITDRLRTKAAQIQQYIDKNIYLEVFTEEQLGKWSNVPLKSKIDEETAKIDSQNVNQEKVENWYSVSSTLSPLYGVFCCQKENRCWDLNLRIKLIISLVIILLIIVGIDIVKVWNLNFKELLPVVICGVTIISFLIKSIYCLIIDYLRINEMNSLFNNVEKKIENDETVGDDLIDIQNLIYENRSKAFLVPDWLYKLFRDKMQKNATAIANEQSQIKKNYRN